MIDERFIIVGVFLSLVGGLNFQHYAFPVYILLLCLVLYILVRFKIGKRNQR
ncbi:MAG: hypothetical protein UV09_C0003G0057 [Candidatus Gottesmanbacteria bacterium GW2011_GWA2_42_18]|uniref:Uncharacterized protein n=1 Tax=Candidatus Gottesmanbacteria bacterium GW2011_GWA2_42_18 TaxID=1618442 RepID=A0A0G0ZG76_9BACT|nr:MAG: hypothetical protein UV09_C0003G0057 [Candidatus Gottesmanbacteria bacterium GW2011_GWA2_42_18]